jgi:hypothetical protein
MRETRNANKIFVGKPAGETPLGRCLRSWEDDIKMDLREIWSEVMDWIHLGSG